MFIPMSHLSDRLKTTSRFYLVPKLQFGNQSAEVISGQLLKLGILIVLFLMSGCAVVPATPNSISIEVPAQTSTPVPISTPIPKPTLTPTPPTNTSTPTDTPTPMSTSTLTSTPSPPTPCLDDVDPLFAELKVYREAGDRIKTAETLNKIGDAFHLVDGTRFGVGAISNHTGALLIWYELGDQTKVTETREKLHCLWEARQEECITYFTNILDEARIQENRLWEAVMLNELGVIYEGQGFPDLAFEHFQQALVIAREIGNPVLEMEASSFVEAPTATTVSSPTGTPSLIIPPLPTNTITPPPSPTPTGIPPTSTPTATR